MTGARPILYSFRRCPYAMRARLAITAAGVGVNLREVVLRAKPQAMLDASSKGTVPVLVLENNSVIDESLDIMRWALGQNDPEGWLAPESGSLEDMLDLIGQNDGDFKHDLDRFKYATRYEDADPFEHRAGAEEFLRVLEARLAQNTWLFGGRACLADYAILPFIRQFSGAANGWWETAPYPHVRGWVDAFKASDFFRSIMKKYPQWQLGDTSIKFP
ncbi:glutathione S-transferase [Kordiimonas aestuarii]|uniref:glutathione S-transferase n=1 Tax=Kordiimonas aestuarii TaxID=1005925 RepID=UPI0021D0D71D|nr:glutathione S-transferase [Kordiimonas aestuarii]